MFRTDTFFSLVDYILKLILIFKILKRHLFDYLGVESILFSKYNPFETKEWVEQSLIHWKITEKLIHVQAFYWEVGDKNNSKRWSLALLKLTGRWKMAPACSRLWESQIKGIGRLRRTVLDQGSLRSLPWSMALRKNFDGEDFIDREGNFKN